MENLLLLAFVAACVAAIVIDKKVRARRRKAEEDAILADMENAARVHEILHTCAVDLKKQRAAGYGPWLSALLDGPMYIEYDERGRIQVKTLAKPVTPGLALSAVHMTIAELSGGRFNLETLYRAASELSNMGQGA